MTELAETPAQPGAARTQGRPRSSRAHEAILEAVLDLLADGVSVEALSMEAIAARAGVGKATIYRRWAGKDELLLEALVKLKGPPPQPLGDSVRADLVRLLTVVGPKDERAVRVMPCLFPEVHRSSEAYRIWQEGMAEPRREVMREVLRRGIATGELRPDTDVEVTTSLLISPMLLHRMVRWNPALDGYEDLAERVVDTVLRGVTA
ncbi:TetR/AcrR family transcriptional regulator [Catellatospora bangladeshensis]|uniref:TetR family transcriptional regulator n=1 Tax=Catellatospora bangladeshensis TaxID=310355 RepID=A0A8J3JUE3_9ACTN|nr:TetR/AcrR family transcriptional regulator [Catellatospora bangladeshensis]GIF83929.1 TetR family transcriptional regulator [Catellatospora bangladeshensis]